MDVVAEAEKVLADPGYARVPECFGVIRDLLALVEELRREKDEAVENSRYSRFLQERSARLTVEAAKGDADRQIAALQGYL